MVKTWSRWSLTSSVRFLLTFFFYKHDFQMLFICRYFSLYTFLSSVVVLSTKSQSTQLGTGQKNESYQINYELIAKTTCDFSTLDVIWERKCGDRNWEKQSCRCAANYRRVQQDQCHRDKNNKIDIMTENDEPQHHAWNGRGARCECTLTRLCHYPQTVVCQPFIIPGMA